MAGRMGTTASPSRRLTVVRADTERNLLLDQGHACPARRNALVMVRKAK